MGNLDVERLRRIIIRENKIIYERQSFHLGIKKFNQSHWIGNFIFSIFQRQARYYMWHAKLPFVFYMPWHTLNKICLGAKSAPDLYKYFGCYSTNFITKFLDEYTNSIITYYNWGAEADRTNKAWVKLNHKINQQNYKLYFTLFSWLQGWSADIRLKSRLSENKFGKTFPIVTQVKDDHLVVAMRANNALPELWAMRDKSEENIGNIPTQWSDFNGDGLDNLMLDF